MTLWNDVWHEFDDGCLDNQPPHQPESRVAAIIVLTSGLQVCVSLILFVYLFIWRGKEKRNILNWKVGLNPSGRRTFKCAIWLFHNNLYGVIFGMKAKISGIHDYVYRSVAWHVFASLNQRTIWVLACHVEYHYLCIQVVRFSKNIMTLSSVIIYYYTQSIAEGSWPDGTWSVAYLHLTAEISPLRLAMWHTVQRVLKRVRRKPP